MASFLPVYTLEVLGLSYRNPLHNLDHCSRKVRRRIREKVGRLFGMNTPNPHYKALSVGYTGVVGGS